MKPSAAKPDRPGVAHPVLIAIGSNLPGADGRPPCAVCEAAAAALPDATGLRLARLSSWWRSPAWPPSDQPDYINGVALLDGTIDPADLLARLQSLEATFGRARGERNAARVLDLDIVAIDTVVRDAPDPILPHPRAHERAFVLRPLAEVCPGWVEPRLGRSISVLLRTAALQHCVAVCPECHACRT